jgi:hypothetical protein
MVMFYSNTILVLMQAQGIPFSVTIEGGFVL